MKIVFVSNMLNHHSKPLCEAFMKLCDEFKFVAMVDSNGEGYQQTKEADFVIKAFKEKDVAEKYVLEADIVVFGANSEEMLKKRMELGKISFLYSERLFKKGFWQKYIPKTRKRLDERIVTYKDNNLYVLSSSAYLPYDLQSIGFPSSKCYRWGYFPEIENKEYDNLLKLKEQNDRLKIIWVGRLIKLKHPEFFIKLAERLNNDGFDFELDVVGDGPLRESLEKRVKNKKLDGRVRFLGTKTIDGVRLCMDCSDILLFTSDFNEGWGAVLNEGMDSGCACVASHAAGSSGYLIKHGENGMLFESGNFDSFYNSVRIIAENEDLRKSISNNAFYTIKNEWNANVASKRLLELYKCLNKGKIDAFEDGPCSKAEVLKHNWYKG